ncbi:MAG: hypothetical protein DRP00_03700 [Candidatus Aenigmatarchaeota archaeon]|nr:MAG: hypothetical protein DRP00_03700 [Candidatus Aenigmarchaeota archaeon]
MKRSRLEIEMLILELIRDHYTPSYAMERYRGTLGTHIAQRANLSWKQLQKFIERFKMLGLIEETREVSSRARRSYVITEKGKLALDTYKYLKFLLGHTGDQ